MKKTSIRCWAWTLALVFLVSVLPPMSMSMPIVTAAQQTALTSTSPQPVSTFTDLPSSAHETYKGSGLYIAPISQNMDIAIKGQEQTRYANFGITPESAPGLPLGSIYLKDATNNKYVELALYERAAYTAYDNAPAPQLLSTIIYEGKVQVSDTEFIELPQSVKAAFLKLPLAGEGDVSTPSVAQMADLMQSHADEQWTQADQMLDAQGKLSTFDIQSHFPNLTPEQAAQYTLGKADAQTGHKTPDIISQGLTKMFGEQVRENAGLPKGPAVWINAKINGTLTPVLFQQYERMALTVNPNNADSPSKVTGDMKDSKNKSVVQVGLQGQIVYNGLLAVDTRPTATPTVVPTTPTPKIEGTPTAATNEGLKQEGRDYIYTFSRARKDSGQMETINVRIDNKDAGQNTNAEGTPENIPDIAINSAFAADFGELMKRLLPDGRTNPTLLISGYFRADERPDAKGFDEVFSIPENQDAKIYWKMTENNNLEIKFSNQDAWQNLPASAQSKFGINFNILQMFVYAIGSRTNKPLLPTELSPIVGRDATALRLYQELGYQVVGYPDDLTRELMIKTNLPPHP